MTRIPENLCTTEEKPSPHTLKPTVFWRIAEDIPQSLTWTLMVLSISIPLGLWWLVSHSGWVEPLFLPTPENVWQAIVSLWTSGDLPQDIVAVYFGFSVVFSSPR